MYSAMLADAITAIVTSFVLIAILKCAVKFIFLGDAETLHSCIKKNYGDEKWQNH